MLRNGLSFLKSFVIRSSVPGSGRSEGWPENRSDPPPPLFLRPDMTFTASPGPSGSSLASRRGALALTGSPDSPGAAGRSCWFRGLVASLLVVIAVAALATSAFAQTSVPANWSLTPTGLTGSEFRLLFLSSTKRDGSVTDIATYNTFIQNLAAAGHTDIRSYSTGFRVVGCTAAVDATANTSTTGTGVAIYWLDGTKVADDLHGFLRRVLGR